MSFAFGKEVDNTIFEQTGAYGNVSNKYIPTSTSEIVQELNKYHNFKPVGFSSANVRIRDKDGYQKHAVMLEAEDSVMFDGTLRVILFNSNDRSSSIRMYLLLYSYGII